MREEGGLTDRICYTFRVIIHLFMIAMTGYFIVMLTIFAFVRRRTSYAGQFTWVARLMSKAPYGSMFF